MAFFLETRTKYIADWKNTLLPAVAPTVVFLLLIVAQPDLARDRLRRNYSVHSVRGRNAVSLLRVRLRRLAAAALFPGLPLSWRRDRILAFLNRTPIRAARAFTSFSRLIAVSTGGLTGLGLMEGKQKLFYLPEPHTDLSSPSPPKN